MPRKPGVEKKQTAIHLTPEARAWLDELAQQNGVSASIQVEKLIRKEAVRKGLDGAREWE